jgi:anhydro-N-acetylmuramic acid kinase
MSGTSMDAIDAALLRIDDHGFELLDCREHPIASDLRERIQELSHPGDNEIERLGELDRELGLCFAEAVSCLLVQAGQAQENIRAIGSHGQTVRHRPPSAQTGNPSAGHASAGRAFTLQIGDPNTIAEVTGITTVADFRRRDIAAGGEAAPLVPAFHAAAFGQAGKRRAIVNIGGIANVTLLLDGEVSGFDTGPGNTLLDQWVSRHRGEPYDALGSWAAEGTVQTPLLERLAAHSYFAAAPPKSTGKEVFNMAWLEDALADVAGVDAQDVQATLAELSASSIAQSLAQLSLDEVYVCGGGAANTDLMRRLYRHMQPTPLATTAELGCDPAWVEAAAFAWLAWRTLEGLPGNVPGVTGATGERVLGAVYPAAAGNRVFG